MTFSPTNAIKRLTQVILEENPPIHLLQGYLNNPQDFLGTLTTLILKTSKDKT